MTKLYVGNLPYSFSDDTLRDLFAPFGAVNSATIIMDKITRRSKGFGFVEFENEEDANNATAELNNKVIESRNIVVNVARPMEDRPKRDFGGSRGGFGGGNRGGFGGDRRSSGSSDRRSGGFRG